MNSWRFGILKRLGLPLAVIWVFTGPICGLALPIFTNLAQISFASSQRGGTNGAVDLTATVFACSTNAGVLALSDSTGAEILELEDLLADFKPGDQIRIAATNCYLARNDAGVYLCATPLLDDDGLHPARTIDTSHFFEAGRYPVRLEWFNQYAAFELQCSGVAADAGATGENQAADASTNLLHAISAQCFQGNWQQLPDFRLLQAVKTGSASNFDIGFRTRNDLVGIRFDGYFEAPKRGNYFFSLRSDDGSRLWIGETGISVKKIGSGAAPTAVTLLVGQAMNSLNEHKLATIEGRVDFVSHSGKGLDLEVHSDQGFAWVNLADSGNQDPEQLLMADVRISGVTEPVLTESQRVVLGKLAVASIENVTVVANLSKKPSPGRVLTSSIEVQSLSYDEAARHLPVTLRGVVTAVGYGRSRWMVLQDDTRGTFVSRSFITNCLPNIGEDWSISGHTDVGNFAPVIIAEQATLLGNGRMPEPAHPDWNQLMNGSMDVQWVELEGLVTDVHSNQISLLLPEGQLVASLPEWQHEELQAFSQSVIRVRGAMFATSSAETHEVDNRSITMHNATISVDKPQPRDPFEAPEKSPHGLFLFDVKATPFQHVKVHGQITYADDKRLFLEADGGLQIIPAARTNLDLGDWVEAVGYPEISGHSPLLRQARLRKLRAGLLPAARPVAESDLADPRYVFTRVALQGRLVAQHFEEDALVMQIEAGEHLLLARVANAGPSSRWQVGSRLLLTGILITAGQNDLPSADISRFALLINSPAEVRVESAPSWWTIERLLTAVGALLFSLALASVWITLLHRQVAQRTLELRHEIHEREIAERERSLEAERSRIARDLHDDLGASLTEISVLAGASRQTQSNGQGPEALFQTITRKSKELVAGLDIIVWALNPQDNSLQLVGDYLCDFAADYLSSFGIACRFDVPVALPAATLDGRRRHGLFLAVKEILNNIVRHAGATEVSFRLGIKGTEIEIVITDNGKGFNVNSSYDGNGLRNLPLRLAQAGGSCDITSSPGQGTSVRIAVSFSPPAQATASPPDDYHRPEIES